MEAIEQLEKSIQYMDDLSGLERAQRLFLLHQRALNKQQRKEHDAKVYIGVLREKYLHQAEIARMASHRLLVAYRVQLLKLLNHSW